MSRIDEAVRRAAGEGREESAPDASQDAFVSAWHLGDGPAVSREPAPKITSLAEPTLHAQPSTVIRGFNPDWAERLVSAPQADDVMVEQFRRLAATLHQSQEANGIRTIMVTSATPDEGKTLTAVNLALILSESYRRRVLLIDADLRRPSIGTIVDLGNAVGLSDALKARSEQKLAVISMTPMLTLLPAGRPDPDPMGGLTSQRMRRILDEAAARFDWVILDAPPIGPVADASLLAEMVDGSLFVLRAGRTQYATAHKALESLGRERLLGVILNGVETRLPEHYARYYSAGRA